MRRPAAAGLVGSGELLLFGRQCFAAAAASHSFAGGGIFLLYQSSGQVHATCFAFERIAGFANLLFDLGTNAVNARRHCGCVAVVVPDTPLRACVCVMLRGEGYGFCEMAGLPPERGLNTPSPGTAVEFRRWESAGRCWLSGR
jgi:hypothetical protein